ncbi:MAG: RHS repeat-associated core domain-containing protein, partial [Bacillota bacterium]
FRVKHEDGSQTNISCSWGGTLQPKTRIGLLRYYNSVTGRWVSRDPLAEKGGVNLYVLLANNGISKVDLLGDGAWEALAQGLVQGAVAVGVAAGVSIAVAAFVGTAPITVTGLIAIGAIASVTGIIQGSRTDGIAQAVGNGVGNGIVQGTVGGAGAAFAAGSTTVNANYTLTQLAVANGTANVVAANVSVAMNGQLGNTKVHVFVSVVALGSSFVTFYHPDEMVNVLINLNIEQVTTITCDASKM